MKKVAYLTVNLNGITIAEENVQKIIDLLEDDYTILSAIGDASAVHYILSKEDSDAKGK